MDGRPVYSVPVDFLSFGLSEVYLFYDKDCSGTGRLLNRWFVSGKKPSTRKKESLLVSPGFTVLSLLPPPLPHTAYVFVNGILTLAGRVRTKQDVCTDKYVEGAWNRGGAYSVENFDWFPPGMPNGWQSKSIVHTAIYIKVHLKNNLCNCARMAYSVLYIQLMSVFFL